MIIRVAKRRSYSAISNVPINDKRLSWDARGVICFLLSKPDNWHISRDGLVGQSPGGKDKITRILAELSECGYLTRRQARNADGQFVWENILREEPDTTAENPAMDNPIFDPPDTVAVNPSPGEPSPGEPPLLNTDLVITERVNTEKTEEPLTVEDLQEGWNDLCAPLGLSKVELLSPTRRTKAKLRIREHPDVDFWNRVMARMRASPFLLGRANGSSVEHHGWKANFDWLIENDTNCVKVYEGRYAKEN